MPPEGAPKIDDRHRWVVRLALEGHSTAGIAAHLDLPERTVQHLLLDVVKHLNTTTQH